MDETRPKKRPDRSRKTCWPFAVLDNVTGLIPGYDMADDKLHYDATALLSRILERLGRVPDVVIADKLNGYKRGFENAVRSRNPSAVLVADVGVNGRHVNNNRRERLNGEFDDCLSRARGFMSRAFSDWSCCTYCIIISYTRPGRAARLRPRPPGWSWPASTVSRR